MYVFSAKGAALNASLGHHAPGFPTDPAEISAESAIHFWYRFDHHSAMPQSLSKVILHIILARRIASPGSMQMCDRERTPTWRRFVAISARRSCASVVRLITFTLSPHYREPFLKLK